MNRLLQCLLIAPVAVAAVLAAGCSDDPAAGYTTRSLYHTNVDSVAVEMFETGRGVYRRHLEDRLTKAVVKRIQYDTRYKITDKAEADTLLTGTIDVVEQAVIHSNPRDARTREQELAFAVSLTWTDLRSGQQLAKVHNLRASVSYLPARPFKEDFFVGSEDEINRLARRIVEQMERDW